MSREPSRELLKKMSVLGEQMRQTRFVCTSLLCLWSVRERIGRGPWTIELPDSNFWNLSMVTRPGNEKLYFIEFASGRGAENHAVPYYREEFHGDTFFVEMKNIGIIWGNLPLLLDGVRAVKDVDLELQVALR